MKWKCPKCGRSFTHENAPHFCGKPQTVDEYIAAQDEQFQNKLKEVRRIFRNALPEAEECISWAMPTYRKGRNIIHFAAAGKHIGIYPGSDAIEKFADDLREYSCSKGAIRIPYEHELPEDLLKRIAEWCYSEYAK